MICIREMGCILVGGLALSQTKSNGQIKDRHTYIIINNKNIYIASLLQLTLLKSAVRRKKRVKLIKVYYVKMYNIKNI